MFLKIILGLAFLGSLAFIGFNLWVSGPIVSVSGVHIPVELARTDESLRSGLSGRSELPSDRGMLFVFEKPGPYAFWMPDMNFPIDIIWIYNNKIIDITSDVSNDFDPQNPRFYKPPSEVNFVLEVNAGFAKSNNIKAGDEVTLRGF